MNYDIIVGKDSGALLAVILGDDGRLVEIDTRAYDYPSDDMFYWVADRLREHNPAGPCSMTRKKVYNERVYGRPGFWEITTYNARGDKLHTAQWAEFLQERHLQGLVQEQMGFPLQAAEEVG